MGKVNVQESEEERWKGEGMGGKTLLQASQHAYGNPKGVLFEKKVRKE